MIGRITTERGRARIKLKIDGSRFKRIVSSDVPLTAYPVPSIVVISSSVVKEEKVEKSEPFTTFVITRERIAAAIMVIVLIICLASPLVAPLIMPIRRHKPTRERSDIVRIFKAFSPYLNGELYLRFTVFKIASCVFASFISPLITIL